MVNYQELFYDYLRFERNMAKNTRLIYEQGVGLFLEYLAKHSIELENVSPADVRNYLRSLKEEGKSERTLATYLVALRSFFAFLNKDNHIKNNPTILIETIKLPKKLPNVLSEDEMTRFLNIISIDDEVGLRDRALFEYMYSTGSRVSEVTDLKFNQLSLPDGAVIIQGKGNKQRIAFLSDAAINYLADYLRDSRPKLLGKKDSNYVFVGARSEHLDRSYVLKACKKYGMEAGIKKEISPHTIRHSFATHLLENDAELLTVKTLLGHANVSTTQIYTHISNKHLRSIYNSAHPFGKKDENK